MRSTNRIVLGGSPPSSAGTAALAPARRAEIVDVRVEPPVVVRHAGGRVLFGAAAAGPLGGDHIEVDVVVEPGVVADVGTVGATMILPSRTPVPSSTLTTIDLGAGSHLEWRPEPMISVAGSVHRADLRLRLDDSASCRLTEEFALGRTGEPSGALTSGLRVERGGRPLLHHAETFGPEQPGAGSLAANPASGHVIAHLVVGGIEAAPAATIVERDRWSGSFPLDDDTVLVLVIAPDRPAAVDLLDLTIAGAMVRPSDHSEDRRPVAAAPRDQLRRREPPC